MRPPCQKRTGNVPLVWCSGSPPAVGAGGGAGRQDRPSGKPWRSPQRRTRARSRHGAPAGRRRGRPCLYLRRWSMPATSLPFAVKNHPEATRFFRSTDVTTQLTGFTGLPAALKVADDFGCGLDVAKGWSAIATPGRRGRHAYVELRRTRDLHGAAVKAASAGRAEEASLRRLLAALPQEEDADAAAARSAAAARPRGGAAGYSASAAEVIEVSDDGSDEDTPILAAVVAAETLAASGAAREPRASAAEKTLAGAAGTAAGVAESVVRRTCGKEASTKSSPPPGGVWRMDLPSVRSVCHTLASPGRSSHPTDGVRR